MGDNEKRIDNNDISITNNNKDDNNDNNNAKMNTNGRRKDDDDEIHAKKDMLNLDDTNSITVTTTTTPTSTDIDAKEISSNTKEWDSIRSSGIKDDSIETKVTITNHIHDNHAVNDVEDGLSSSNNSNNDTNTTTTITNESIERADNIVTATNNEREVDVSNTVLLHDSKTEQQYQHPKQH